MLLLITGVGLLFASLILKSQSPDINNLYGYRTKRSMSNQKMWDFAQKYSAKVFLRIAILNIIIGLPLMIFITYSKDYYIAIELVWVVISCSFVFYLTEKGLKKMEQSL